MPDPALASLRSELAPTSRVEFTADCPCGTTTTWTATVNGSTVNYTIDCPDCFTPTPIGAAA